MNRIRNPASSSFITLRFCPEGELPSDIVPFDAASTVAVEDQKEAAMLNIHQCLRSGQAARALALLRASRSGKTHMSVRCSGKFLSNWSLNGSRSFRRLYWYRVVKYYCRAWWFGSKCDLSLQISPLGGCLVSALSIPIEENGTFPLLTLTTITSMLLQNKQASRPLHVHTTMQPQAKLLYVKCTRLWNKKNKKEWHLPPNN